MPKAGDLDWSDLHKTGNVESPTSQAIRKAFGNANVKDSNRGGENVTKEQLVKEALDIVRQANLGQGRQTTDQELFGHLEVSEEMAKKAEDKWNNTFNDHFKQINQPVDAKNANPKLEEAWESGKSFNSLLTEEELKKRNTYVGE